MNVTVNGEPVPETAGNTLPRSEDMPGGHAVCDAEIARLRARIDMLGREHNRHSLAVEAHKGRSDQQESRAIRAEKQLARFAGQAERYEELAERAELGQRAMDLEAELRRRLAILGRRLSGRGGTFTPDPEGPIPHIVCLCGSTRFGDAFREANLRLTLQGAIVLSIGCDTKTDADLAAAGELGKDPERVKRDLDELHRRKIDLADEVLVVSRDGYFGQSTAGEIAYAAAQGKPVRFAEPAAEASWACNAGRPVRWDTAVPPGGWVCAVPAAGRNPEGICGMPVESEPCPEHRGADWSPQ